MAQTDARPTENLVDLAPHFVRFAQHECRGVSPLYQVLARGVAKDPDLLALAAHAAADQPAPNMLFAAVRFLLLGAEGDDPLIRFYPSATGKAAPSRYAFPAFRAFCLRHAGKLAGILRSCAVSTNEPARSACLLPAFALAAAQGGGAPLHLVEVGASAGLTLIWDRYAFAYEGRAVVGDAAAGLVLPCEILGRRVPPMPVALPAVASRVGIDRHPLNAANEADARWLRALIWPEQAGRAARLNRALAMARADPPPLIAGNALALLPEVLLGLPADGTLCLYHAFTLSRFPPPARAAIAALLAKAARRRPVRRIGLEWGDGPAPELRFWAHSDGGVEERLLAYCDPHGAWIEWLVD